jgi:hypothetical protein
MQFMADLDRNEDGGLQIMYGIDGRRDLGRIRARGSPPPGAPEDVVARASPRVAATSSAPVSTPEAQHQLRSGDLAAATSWGPVEDGAPATCRLLCRSATRVAYPSMRAGTITQSG